MSADSEAGDDIAAGGLSGRQLTGEMYSCSSEPAPIRYICAMPCTRISRLMLKSRLIHLLHWRSPSRIVLSPMVIVADFAALFQWMVSGSRTSSRASSPAIFILSASVSADGGALARSSRSCCLTIGLGGPTSSVWATSPSKTSRLRMPPNSVLPSS